MPQYVSKTFTTEAYLVGETVPEWFEEGVKEKTFVPVFKNGTFCIVGWKITRKNGDITANVGDYIIKTDDDYSVIDATTFEDMYVYDDADIDTVLSKTLEITAGDGTKANPFVAAISVANATATVARADIAVDSAATMNLYSNNAFTTEITGSNTITLTAGAATAIYVKVTSAAGTNVVYYKVNITRAAE